MDPPGVRVAAVQVQVEHAGFHAFTSTNDWVTFRPPYEATPNVNVPAATPRQSPTHQPHDAPAVLPSTRSVAVPEPVAMVRSEFVEFQSAMNASTVDVAATVRLEPT